MTTQDKLDKAAADFKRWLRKLKLAVTKVDKLQKRIDKYEKLLKLEQKLSDRANMQKIWKESHSGT